MNEVDAVRFLLVPDAGARRRVRRLIVHQGACTGVVVGTWSELIEWARRAYQAAGFWLTGEGGLSDHPMLLVEVE